MAFYHELQLNVVPTDPFTRQQRSNQTDLAFHMNRIHGRGGGSAIREGTSPGNWRTPIDIASRGTESRVVVPEAAAAMPSHRQIKSRHAVPAYYPFKHKKVLFVGTDGVLHPSLAHPSGRFPDSCMLAFKSIVDHTMCQVVLLPSWRPHTGGADEVMEQMRRHLVRYPVYSLDATSEAGSAHYRADDIGSWLSRHPTERWAVISDTPMHGYRGHYVSVDPLQGLTAANAAQAIDILNGMVSQREEAVGAHAAAAAMADDEEKGNAMQAAAEQAERVDRSEMGTNWSYGTTLKNRSIWYHPK